jgi:hypothetical protein
VDVKKRVIVGILVGVVFVVGVWLMLSGTVFVAKGELGVRVGRYVAGMGGEVTFDFSVRRLGTVDGGVL